MTSWRVGSDQAGQTAATQAAKRGNKVGLIERREVSGGGCIHSGTIPSTSWREWVRSLAGFHQRGRSGVGSRVKPDSTTEGLVFLVSQQIVTCLAGIALTPGVFGGKRCRVGRPSKGPPFR
jgi:pyruvate/2-oxoglutarate dehydrogenase complex dihydrolipoamide dehydrogenase (E3) component